MLFASCGFWLLFTGDDFVSSFLLLMLFSLADDSDVLALLFVFVLLLLAGVCSLEQLAQQFSQRAFLLAVRTVSLASSSLFSGRSRWSLSSFSSLLVLRRGFCFCVFVLRFT